MVAHRAMVVGIHSVSIADSVDFALAASIRSLYFVHGVGTFDHATDAGSAE